MADNDIKVTSMRLNSEDIEKFKEFASNNDFNQQQAFNSLLALAELEKAKTTLGDRSKSIEVFRDTVTKLMNFYINALEENVTTEDRIREELQKELSTKDNTIATLHGQLDDLKGKNKMLADGNKEINQELEKSQNAFNNKVKEYSTLEDQLKKSNDFNSTLQEQLQEYKEYKNQYKYLEKELEQLKKDYEGLKTDNTRLDNSNKQLQDKLTNSESMIKFYIDNIDALKKDIEGYKAENKLSESKYSQEIINIKNECEKHLEKESNVIREQLQSKHEVELGKKDLELQKLSNEIEKLKPKSATSTSRKKPE